MIAPPAWKDIEESEQYLGMSTPQRRATFLKWDDQSRDLAQEQGLWEDKDFQTQYEKNSNEVLNSFASPTVKAWNAIHNSEPIKQIRTARDSIIGGWLEGERANEIQARNDPNEVARLSAEIDKYKPTEEFSTAWNPDVPAAESWNAFKKDPLGNISQLLARSFASQTKATLPYVGKIPERTAETVGALGAATGIGMAAAGPGAPAVGAVGAAALPVAVAGGVQWGFHEAGTLASYANEYGGQYVETLQENGVDITDKDALTKAYQNKELMQKARTDAENKGLPVAVWDGISGLITGNLLHKVPGGKGIARGLKMAGKWMAELGVEGLAGAGGELHSQIATKGEIYDPKAALAEFGAEYAQGTVNLAVNKTASLIAKDPVAQAQIEAIQGTATGLEQAGAPITASVVQKQGVQAVVDDIAQTDDQLTEEVYDEEQGDVDAADTTLGDSTFAPATKTVVESQKVKDTVEEPNKLEEAVTTVTEEGDVIAEPATTVAKAAAPAASQTMFNKLVSGDLTSNGKADQTLSNAYLAYTNGDIKNPKDLETWLDKQTTVGAGERAVTPKTDEAIEPTKARSYTFEVGQPIVVEGAQGATVHKVREDGKIIVKSETTGKTRYTVIDPVETNVEVVTTGKTEYQTEPSTAPEIALRLNALPDDVADSISDLPLNEIPAAIFKAEQQQKVTPAATKTKTTTHEATKPTTAQVATVPTVEKAGAEGISVGPAAEQKGVSAGVKPAAEPAAKPAKVSEKQPAKLAELEQKAAAAKASLEAIGPEPHKPSSEKKFFGYGGKEGLRKKKPQEAERVIAEYDASVKKYNTWKRAYSKLKKAEVETSNAAFYEREAEQKAKTTEQAAKAEPAKTEPTKAAQEEKPPAPVAKSKEEQLEKAGSIIVKAPSGVTTIRVTDSKGRQSVELIKNVNKGRNVFQGAGPFTKVEVGVKDGKGNFVAAKTDFTVDEGPEIKGTEEVAEPAVVTKKASKAKPNRQAKTKKALTKDTTPDPYDGAPLNQNTPATVEEASENLGELERLGILDDDATAQSVMQHIINDPKTPRWVRSIAQILQKIGVNDLAIEASYRPDSSWAGLYDGPRNRILINTAMMGSGNMLHIILHEAAHHVTLGKINGKFDLNSVELAAIDNLQSVLEQIRKMPEFEKEYGLRNVAELISEVFSNSRFRNKLNRLSAGKINVWDKIVNAIARLFYGQNVMRGSALEYAMQQALDLAGDGVVERPTSTAAYGGILHTIAESAWRAGYNNNNDELQQLHQRNPAMRNELNQAYGLGRKKAREQAAPLAIWDVAQQEIGSADTSINAKQLPAVFNFVSWVKGTTNADIGGGRFENATDFLKNKGVTNYVFDPFNRTKEHNQEVVKKIAGGQTDTSTVANVLNVIKEAGARDQVIRQAADAVKPEGAAYFKIYEGNKDGKGAVTTKGWQEHRRADTYIAEIAKHFSNVTRKADILIAVNPIKEGQSEVQGSAIAPVETEALFDKDATPEARAFAAAKLLQDTATIAPLLIDEAGQLTPAQSKMVVDNLDMASRVANQFQQIPLTSYEERQSEARLGLIKAAINYDPAKNDNFRSYSVRIIKNTLTDLLRKKIRQSHREVSSNVPIGEEGEETFQDTFTEEEPAPQPDAGALEVINKIRESLSPRDQKILNDFATGMPLRDVADLHNMSHEGVRKVIKRAGAQIVEALEAAGITDIDNIFPPVERRQPATAKKVSKTEDEQEDISEKAVGKLEKEDTKITQALKDTQDPETPGVFHFGDQDLIAPLPSFHGTKHKIKERMSTKYIGSGEGTQAYGWGLYSAQRLGVAKGYQETAGGWIVDGEPTPGKTAAEQLALANIVDLGYEAALAEAERAQNQAERNAETMEMLDAGSKYWQDVIDTTKALKGKEVSRNKGNLYKLEIIPKEEDLLDWDKTLAQQSDKVKGILKKLGVEGDHRTGEEIYRSSLKYIEAPYEYGPTSRTDEQVSKMLDAAGIPGLQFFDRGSRHIRTQETIDKELKYAEQDLEEAKENLVQTEKAGASGDILRIYKEDIYHFEYKIAKLKAEKPNKEGTHNYVMFDGKYIEILEENGKPVGKVSEADIAPLMPEQQAAEDKAYADAVAKGDTSAAQKMVDQKAKAAGYTEKVRHATPFKFREFIRNMISRSDPDTNIRGFHVGTEADVYSAYVSGGQDRGAAGPTKLLNLYLKLGKTIDRRTASQMVHKGEHVDGFPKGYDTVIFDDPATWTQEIQDQFDKTGEYVDKNRGYTYRYDKEYDGVDLYDTDDQHVTGYENLKQALDPDLTGGAHYIVKESNQLKLADAVTYDKNGNVIPLSRRFDESKADIAAISPEAQETKVPWFKQKKGAYKALGKLTSAGGRWSKELYDALKIKTHKARAAFVNSIMLDNQLKQLYKKHYPNGITDAERSTINTALGNIENYYTDVQWKEAKKITDPEEKAAFLLTAKLENFEKFRQQQAAAMASLPDEIQEVITEMREERNGLQEELKNSNNVSEELRYSIDDSKDLYIHRTYDIFEDPQGKWVDWVRNSDDAEAQRIRAGATRIFRAKARAEMAKFLLRHGHAADKADALAQASQMDLSDRINELFTEYTEIGDNRSSVDIMRGRKEGQKRQDILRLRGVIPKEIRELWGERQDPAANFAKTASSISAYLANDEFLNTVLQDGLSKGYIAKKDPNNPNWKRPAGFVKIVGDDAEGMKPLEGVYGPAMLRDAMEEMGKQRKGAEDFFSKATGWVMKGKTVLSTQALMRNFTGNILIAVANGNWNLMRLGNAGRAAWANTWKNASDKDKRAYLKKLVEKGIIGDNVTSGILKDLNHYSELNDTEFQNALLNRAAKIGKGFDSVMQGLYNGADDIWKVYAFESEKAKLTKALGNTASTEEIENRAAKIVRRTTPTYSEAFKVTADLFRGTMGKLVAPFITFTTEIIRVTGGTFMQAFDELKDSNPKIKAIGAQRLVGTVIASTALYGVGQAAKAAFDYDDEDEEAVRRGLPPWQRNAQIMFWGNKGDKKKHTFIDLSYLNPYNFFTDPAVALIRGISEGQTGRGIGEAIYELSKPFISEQLLLSQFYDQLRNQKADGGRIFNPADSLQTQMGKRAAYLGKIMPGLLTSAGRLAKAAVGVVEHGRSYNLASEIAAPLTGFRIQEYDAENSFMYQTGRFNKEKQNASQVFNDIYGSTSTVSKGGTASAYNTANSAHKLALQNLNRDYKAVLKLGVPEKQAKKIMKENKVGKDNIKSATRGVYKRWEPGEIRDRIKKAHPERDTEFREAFSEAKRTEAL